MDTDDEVKRLLATTATNAERVKGLTLLGIEPKLLAHAVRCQSLSTLRNWGTGQTKPRADAAITLDDLRIVALTLLNAGMERERIVSWLGSRDTERFEGMRPVDMVSIDPMDVLAAATGEALKVQEAARPVLALVSVVETPDDDARAEPAPATSPEPHLSVSSTA